MTERDVILDSITEGVFTVGPDWRITSFNRAAERITGIPREDAIGKRCCDVFRANICEKNCALRRTMGSSQPVYEQTVYIVNSDGRRIPISVSTALLKDRSGSVIGGVEAFRDLTLIEELRKEIEGRHALGDVISKNHKMLQIFDVLPDIAKSDTTVLIEGESGTGKELLAKAIHENSPRADGPFVAVNCAALPDTLLESELFGHKTGAFTGATEDREGRFARAEGGTILLDEIGDITPALQVRLLRVLQERAYERLGSSEPVRTDVRVIASTNRDLSALTEEGEFRSDLYYRINVVRLRLPPLRERREDLPLLIDHFIRHFDRLRSKGITEIAPEALAILMRHDYPGNVRELENIIEHCFVLCRGDTILPEHLPEHLRPGGGQAPAAKLRSATLRDAEARAIMDALRRNGYNRLAAARELGVHKSTLFRKVKSLGLKVPGRGAGKDER